MEHTIIAQHDSWCASCGELVQKNLDRIRLQGVGKVRIWIKGKAKLVGKSGHVDCSPEDSVKAPHLTWEQVHNLLVIVEANRVDPDERVNVQHLRRFKSALRITKANRTDSPRREDKDPAIALSDPFLAVYIWLLKRTGTRGDWWRPWDVARNQPWQPQTERPAEPERLPYNPATDTERRDRMAALRNQFLRDRKAQ